MKNMKLVIFRQSLVPLLMLLMVVAGVIVPAPAQVGQSTLTGTVEDVSGAVIPGAAITLTDTNNQTQRTATSDAHGFFSFTSLPAYTYEAGLRSFSDIARFGAALGNVIYGIEPGNGRHWLSHGRHSQ